MSKHLLVRAALGEEIERPPVWAMRQAGRWDPEFAKRSGNPTTFDYGRMRETWLIHLCTDWMGEPLGTRIASLFGAGGS